MQVMNFSNDEKETVILYDYLSDTYTISTNVKKHITICMKKYADYVTIDTVDKNGMPTSISVKGVKDVISFRGLKS